MDNLLTVISPTLSEKTVSSQLLSMETNDFAKTLRAIRKKRNELLGDMANKLGISAAYLSRVENGFTKPSERLISGVIEIYELAGKERDDLETLGYALRNNNLFDFSRMSARKKKLLIDIAQNVPDLSAQKIDAIYAIINSKEE